LRDPEDGSIVDKGADAARLSRRPAVGRAASDSRANCLPSAGELAGRSSGAEFERTDSSRVNRPLAPLAASAKVGRRRNPGERTFVVVVVVELQF
jgi:hypothetical protein